MIPSKMRPLLRSIASIRTTLPRYPQASISFPLPRHRELVRLSSTTTTSPATASTAKPTAAGGGSAAAGTPIFATSSTPPPRPKLPYLVSRTPSNNLPVYDEAKAAGSQKLTLIRKIQGDHKALMRDLREALSLPDGTVTLNPITHHVVVKVGPSPFPQDSQAVLMLTVAPQGRHTPAIKNWLMQLGF